MNPVKPKYKIGDRIQCGGAPSEVAIVKNVQLNTDGRGNFYTLETPARKQREVSAEAVDKTYVKNAHAFDRQENLLNEESLTPGFDKNGFPTFEDEK